MDKHELICNFESRVTGAYCENRPRSKPSGHYASMVGHACPFFLWAFQAKWEAWPKASEYLQGIFRQGRDGEKSVTIDLLESGYELSGQQNHFVHPELNIRGRMDGYLYHPDIVDYVRTFNGFDVLPRSWRGIPAEIKTTSTFSWRYFTNFQEMLDSPRMWIRKYPMQSLVYGDLDPEESPVVAMIVRCKQDRQTLLMIETIEDHRAEIQACYSRVALVNQHLEAETEPEPIPYSHVWCEKCDAWQWCKHSLMCHGKGAVLLSKETSSELLELHRTIESTRQPKKDHETAKKALRSTLERLGRLPDDYGESVVTAGHGLVIQAKAGGPVEGESKPRITIGVKEVANEA